MLRTILILAAVSLLCSVAYAQTKIGDNVLDIDSASILELESSSRGFLPSRMTSAQRDAQTQWDQAHIIYNTTENCLQIYTGSLWLCLQQGTSIDSSIYKQNGTLRSDRTVTMNGSDLTFDGSRDIIITDDGRLGIGGLSPDVLLDVEGGTVRLSDYGSGVNSGQRTFLLGVDSDGDVITVDTSSVGTDDQTIDALFIQNDTLFISLEDDGVSDLFVNLAPYLDGDTDWLAFGGSKADNILDTIYTFGNVGINTNSPGASLHVVDQADTYAGPWAIIEGGGGVFPNTALQLYDKGTGANNQNIIEFAHRVSGNPVALATIRSHSDAADHVNGADLILETSNDNSGTLNTNQLYLKNNGRIGIGTSTPDEDLHIAGDMRLDGAFEDKDGDAGSSGDVLTSTVSGTDWVSASTIGSDDQMIDTFSINVSNELLISLENDGEAAQKVDLSVYLDDQTVAITGAGINVVTGTYPNFTITGTEVDGSITNEAITNFTYTAASGELRIVENAINFVDTITVMSGASGGSAGVRGLVPDALAGEQSYLLTAAGTWVDPNSLSGTNIYTSDGTLDADRTVGLSTFDLVFDGTSDIIFESDGDVGIGTTTPGARLEVAGGSVIFDEYGVGTQADTSADYILATNPDGDVVELNTAKNSRWFYAPAVTIDASDTITNTTLDLYQEYEDQFLNPDIRSTGAPTSLPLYSSSDLWYYVSYHDDTVIDNISIDASGVMTYDIIDVPFDNYTIVNVIFLIK